MTEGFLEALHRRVAERVAAMPEGEATRWIEGHGLLSVSGTLPEGIRERLRHRVRETAAYNLYAAARFREVVDTLGDVPVCPVKGIYLLDTVYRDDPGVRPLGDLDLLVPAGSVDEAAARLEDALGLEETPTSFWLRRVHPERTLTDGRLTVELHARLGYAHGWASSWADLAPAPARVHGRPVHALDRETTLVHLVTHLVKHRPLSRLVWVEDVLRWVASGVDGRRALAVARRTGGCRAFTAGVRAIRRVAGEDFLPEVPAGDRLARAAERWLWPDLAAGHLPDPSAAATGGRVAAGRALGAVVLADRPALALRYLQVKAAEVLLRPRGR